MCGIYGTINTNIPLEVVTPFLIHRGPDAQKSYAIDNVQLHHFRLSILDHVGGVQPMHRGDLVVIFNGELYNHLDVRQKFNLQCATNSDTETLLAAFEKLGSSCLDEFDGMFAFAIYHKQKQELFLARDRAGKKPLYIYRRGNETVFASELKALSNTLSLQPHLENINLFFKGSFIGQALPFRDVLELEGGHFAIISTKSNHISIKKWWSINDFYALPKKVNYTEAENEVQNIVSTAVARRISASDLEVGAFLSGGIDSGLVVAKAVEHCGGKLKTFTVAMPGAYDESSLAATVARKFDTDHTQINIDFSDLEKDFETIVSNYGEPFFDSSAIPSYYVSKAAKEHVTVILNGDGADELFAGYRRYVPTSQFDFYSNRGKFFWKALKSLLPIAHEKKSYYNYLYRLVSSLSMNSGDTYWSLTSDIFQSQEQAYTNPDTRNVEYIEKFLADFSSFNGLDKQMSLDFHILLQGILLKKMDIATMAHSLEGRSPFLCKEILEYAPQLPSKFKINGTTTKFILRNIAKKWLPEEIHQQPKRGFEIPLKTWMNNELSGLVKHYLNQTNIFSHQFIRKEYIDNLLAQKVQVSDEVRAKMLYQLLVTEIWAKKNGFQ